MPCEHHSDITLIPIRFCGQRVTIAFTVTFFVINLESKSCSVKKKTISSRLTPTPIVFNGDVWKCPQTGTQTDFGLTVRVHGMGILVLVHGTKL